MATQSQPRDANPLVGRGEGVGGASRVFDPVCGMDVNPDDPKTENLERNKETYYFCSTACREQFEATPEEFAA
jgi:YHS domain-containing protein